MLVRKGPDGDYAIPFLVVVDAFHSETVGFADLVLPDTTYLERYDAISLLDRPISEPDMAADSIRHPILKLDRDVRPWQDVLVELASRLKLPAFTQSRRYAQIRRLPGLHRQLRKTARHRLSRRVARSQWRVVAARQAQSEAVGKIHREPVVLHPSHGRRHMRYYRFANKDYLEFAEKHALFGTPPVQVILQMYSEPLQKFRLAGQGLYDGPQPPYQLVDGERLATYFDPLPFWYAPLEGAHSQVESAATDASAHRGG